MGGMLQDLGRAARSLARAPGFTAVVVLTLGLGIGATTSIFSVVYGALLAPLPYPDPDRIVSINERVESNDRLISISYVNGKDWKGAQTTLEALALIRGGAMTLVRADGADQVAALFADPEFFEIFGATAAVGRLYGPDDNVIPGGHPVTVLTHEAWMRQFGGERDIVGSSINLGGTPFTVLGVLSSDFRDPFPGANGGGNDVIIPAMMTGEIDPRGSEVVEVRRWRTFGAVGKLRPGVTAEQANADLRRIATRLQEVDAINRGMSADVIPYNQANTQAIRGPTLTLLAAALFLLIIACFNVANLLLVRGASRTQEMAVQLALGAGRRRVFRLLAAESTILTLAGGALGIVAAGLALPWLTSLIPTQLPPTADVRLSLPVLAAALAASMAAGTLFGLAPAFKQSDIDLRTAMSGSGRSIGHRKGDRVRNGLVLFEIATATILVASSALIIRSFQTFSNADSGFESENVLTLQVNLPPATYPDDLAMGAAAIRLTDRIAVLPGVLWAHPWGPGRPGLSFNYQTSVPDGMLVEQISDAPLARRHHVAPGTLDDMGLTLLQGRMISAEDHADAPHVVVIGESMANELWPGENPIGKRYHNFQPAGAPIPENRHWTVIGVVSDANHAGRIPFPGAIGTPNDSYFSIAQRPERGFTVLVKTTTAPKLAPIRDEIRAFDPNIPIFQVATVAENFAEEEATSRFAAQIMGGFGLAAMLLAALGVYGVISFTVAQRTREIGLRAALGADAASTLRHFVRSGVILAGSGVAVGAIAAFSAARGLQAVVANVPEMEISAVATAGATLLVVAVLACLIPAYRATRIAPVVALKGE